MSLAISKIGTPIITTSTSKHKFVKYCNQYDIRQWATLGCAYNGCGISKNHPIHWI